MTDTVDDFLEHFGVKGMHWGKHSAQTSTSGGTPGKSRKELRALDKASFKSDREKHAKEVDAAREKYNTGAREKFVNAKAQYKADKHVIGKREALKAFNKVKDENIKDFEKASEYRDGKEAAIAVVATVVGGIAISALSAALRG